MSSGVEIKTMLVLSTEHLPTRFYFDDRHTVTGLSEWDHGYFLWVPDAPAKYDNEPGDGEPEIVAVREFASAHGCDWILFDSDGPIVANLPTYAE